ncbi:MAG: cell wall hydrolase [Mobilitalea sp.]
MITTKKLLGIMIASIMISICFGTTAYASETDTTSSLPTQTTTEGLDNTTDLLDTDGTVTDADENAVIDAELTDAYVLDKDGNLVLAEGYYMDEQGEIYYDAPVEKEIIIETAEDDAEIEKEVKESEKESEESKEKTETTVKKATYSKADLRLLSCLVYSEAGNQSYKGMLAVANVVLNRADSSAYWHVDTIKEVIYDRKWAVQFSVTIRNRKSGLSMMDKALKYYDTGKFTGSNPTAQEKAMSKAVKAAKAALEGTNNIGSYLCFTNKNNCSSIKKNYNYKIIGDHIFYRTK